MPRPPQPPEVKSALEAEATVQQQLVDLIGPSSELVSDPRYALPDGGYDLQLRLADDRARPTPQARRRTRWRCSSAGDAAQHEANRLMLATLGIGVAFLCGALAQAFSRRPPSAADPGLAGAGGRGRGGARHRAGRARDRGMIDYDALKETTDGGRFHQLNALLIGLIAIVAAMLVVLQTSASLDEARGNAQARRLASELTTRIIATGSLDGYAGVNSQRALLVSLEGNSRALVALGDRRRRAAGDRRCDGHRR